jgi:hypothetical protein
MRAGVRGGERDPRSPRSMVRSVRPEARDQPLVEVRGRREERHARCLRVASSSAARSRMRSSSVIACQRVPRRWPVRRIRPAVSKSRSSLSTWSRFAPACSASADVVSSSLPDSSASSRSAVMTLDVPGLLRRDGVRARLRDMDSASERTSAGASCFDCADVLVWELARGPRSAVWPRSSVAVGMAAFGGRRARLGRRPTF